MKEKLLALRAELEQLASTTDAAADVVELDQSKVGRLTRMDAMQAQAVAQASVRRRQQMLRRISAALERIEAGHYGRCENCDELISDARLEVDPTAIYCITCAGALEC